MAPCLANNLYKSEGWGVFVGCSLQRMLFFAHWPWSQGKGNKLFGKLGTWNSNLEKGAVFGRKVRTVYQKNTHFKVQSGICYFWNSHLLKSSLHPPLSFLKAKFFRLNKDISTKLKCLLQGRSQIFMQKTYA